MKQNFWVYHKRQISMAVFLARKCKTFHHNFLIIKLYPIERNLSFALKVGIGSVVREKESVKKFQSYEQTLNDRKSIDLSLNFDLVSLTLLKLPKMVHMVLKKFACHL